MQVVILCGGKGTRMGNDELPKALFPVGDKPILWHIMRIYAHYRFKDFILCLGYKGFKIKEYFQGIKEWDIRFVDTGLETNTGGRIYKARKHIEDDIFFVTYGDGLADIDFKTLLEFHQAHKKSATLSVVRPHSTFGIVGIDSHTDTVTHFDEKPVLDHWINGGFFVFNREVFKYINENDILESDCFPRIAKERQLSAYKHNGFWECMDTYKDNLKLNQLWKEDKAPWAVWKGRAK